MSQVSLGQRIQHKGFKCFKVVDGIPQRHDIQRKVANAKTWKFTRLTDNATWIVNNFREFCRENGLARGNMRQVLDGVWSQYKGFVVEQV